MNRATLFLAGMIVTALTVVVVAQRQGGSSAEGKQVTVTGELIDTACFVSSAGDAKGQDHAECAKECMGSGIPAAILPEDAKEASAAMYLLTNPIVLAPYAGQTIRVEGTAYEQNRAIDVKRLFVKQGSDWKEVQLKDAHHKMGEGAHGHGGHGEPKDGHK